jgi:nicotinate-nucleotide adenylyltransferase
VSSTPLNLREELPGAANLKIGLLGGSFNPAHQGHKHISLVALHRLGLDEVWWLVSPQNPLKPAQGMAPLDQRLTQARAVASDPRIRVSDLEKDLGTRFTVDTVKRIKRMFPKIKFVWIMGADNLRQIPRWRQWQALFETLPIAILGRPTYSLGALAGAAARRFRRHRLRPRGFRSLANRAAPAWVFIPGPLHGGSATSIREAQKQTKVKE